MLTNLRMYEKHPDAKSCASLRGASDQVALGWGSRDSDAG